MPDYHRILITGAAGSLGGHLRAGLDAISPTACAWSTCRTWARPRRTRRS